MSPLAHKLVLIGLAAGLLLTAEFFYLRSSSSQSQGLPQVYSIDGVCLNCGESGQFSYPAQQTQPLVCPRCGERAVFSWFYCRDCRLRFVPPPRPTERGPARLPHFAKCTCCDGSHVGAYLSEDPTQEVLGDMPLPPWPPQDPPAPGSPIVPTAETP